jgi:hypothetical protein
MTQAIREELIEELLQGYSSPEDLPARRGCLDWPRFSGEGLAQSAAIFSN